MKLFGFLSKPLRKKPQQAAKCTVSLPKGPECKAPEEHDYPVYFVDYVGCILAPNPQPLTNPDQLIGWERK